MTPLAWMVAAAGGSWLAVTVAADRMYDPELLLGMLGPLGAVGATWIAIDRVHHAAPERLTGVLVVGVGLKMVFFGAYVAVMLRGLALRPVPFVASFTSYFIALYAMEALFLKRLLANDPRWPGR